MAGRECITRRKWLKGGALLGAALGSPIPLAACPANRETSAPPKPLSRIAAAYDSRLGTSRLKVESTVVRETLDRALQRLCNCDNPIEAWKRFVQPGQTVGLKVNCLGGRGIATSSVLVDAVAESLKQAGIRASDIVIWDRLNRDLENAGYRLRESGTVIRCFGNDHLGYASELSISGEAGSLLCRTLTEVCDVIISLPVLKDHGIVGITGALKNLFGAIHNPNKYHPNGGDPYIPDVFMLGPIQQKVRLTIVDGITGQYEGGPSNMPQWTWPFNGLLAGTDPVAIDHTCWRIIEQKRAEMGLMSLGAAGREPRYIATAAEPRRHLGTNDPEQIELLEA